MVLRVDVVVDDEGDAGVDDALRLAGGAAGVEHDARLVGLHRLGRAGGGGGRHPFVPPEIATWPHRHRGAAAPDHQDRVDAVEALDCLVGGVLERHDVPAAEPAVGGDDHLGPVRLEPVAQGPRGEAGEHRVEQRANPQAGEHGHDRFAQVRREDADGVAPANPELPQHVRRPVDLRGQHPIRVEPRRAVFAFPDERQPVACARRQVPVEQVDRRVGDAADEIPEVREATLADRVPRPDPFQLAGDFRPEGVGVLTRVAEERLEGLDAATVRARRASHGGVNHGSSNHGGHITGFKARGFKARGFKARGFKARGVQSTGGSKHGGFKARGVQSTGVQSTGGSKHEGFKHGVQSTGVQSTGFKARGFKARGVRSTEVRSTTAVFYAPGDLLESVRNSVCEAWHEETLGPALA